ncbi:MAG: SpoIID/LytB domain-containing protein [Candidatus Gastranaerophilales bacterium]|nr:SpoIID/LytB domain-containing protein [Candidatus Gastranaerophilales bacterium]
MLKLIITITTILIFGSYHLPVLASDNSIPIRVGISDTKFSTYLFDSIEFNDVSGLNVMDSATGYTVPLKGEEKVIKVTSENNLFRIYVNDELVARNLTGPVLVRAKEGNAISIAGLKRKGKQALYRGYIELTRSSKDCSKFSVVNVLSLKNYLRGVVPNEMPVKFGLEALKAQTVAARNYAIAPRIKAYQEFDLCDSVACQVYFGANTEDSLSDEAVEQTNGIIAIDNEDKPILALYSSTAGGYTESYKYAFSDPETKAFPSKDIHYLSATPDKPEFELLNNEKSAEKFYTSQPESFDDMSPYYRWSKEWSKDELEEVLSKTLISQSKTGFVSPQLFSKEDFGKLQSINVLERGNSGKIIKLQIKTDKNTYIVSKELVIRRCFQKNGISLPSANFVITLIDSEKPVYKFSGGGFGHGVGLSQWGAGKMSYLGFMFDEILMHYYKGIKLATIPVRVAGNSKVIEKIFYTEHEKAKVCILNKSGLSKMKILVNGKGINVKLKDDKTFVDISRYLNKGVNKITYLILDDTIYSKYVEAYIIVRESDNE